MFAGELRALANEPFKGLIDTKQVRRAIREFDRHVLHADAVAEAVIEIQRRGSARLDRQGRTARDLLGPSLSRHIESLLTQPTEPSKELEALLRQLVQQEFVTSLLTDLVFTAISTFYQRVNPLFGAFTMRTMEDQIKTFIRRYMPMLQDRVTAFALSTDNQHAAHQLSRAIAQQVLSQSLADYAAMVSPRQRKQLEAIVREALSSREIDALGRQLTLALFDDVYAVLRNQKVGDLFRLHQQAQPIAEHIAAAAIPLLSRPGFVRFFSQESQRASQALVKIDRPAHARRKKEPTIDEK